MGKFFFEKNFGKAAVNVFFQTLREYFDISVNALSCKLILKLYKSYKFR